MFKVVWHNWLRKAVLCGTHEVEDEIDIVGEIKFSHSLICGHFIFSAVFS